MKAIVLCAVLLSGCSYLSPVVQRGSDAYDDLRQGAEFTLCKAISVGAWVRAYGSSKDRAAAWRELCHEPVAELPVAQ